VKQLQLVQNVVSVYSRITWYSCPKMGESTSRLSWFWRKISSCSLTVADRRTIAGQLIIWCVLASPWCKNQSTSLFICVSSRLTLWWASNSLVYVGIACRFQTGLMRLPNASVRVGLRSAALKWVTCWFETIFSVTYSVSVRPTKPFTSLFYSGTVYWYRFWLGLTYVVGETAGRALGCFS
jgi:hypothetical protein